MIDSDNTGKVEWNILVSWEEYYCKVNRFVKIIMS